MEDYKSFLKNGSLNLSKMEFIEEEFEQGLDMDTSDGGETIVDMETSSERVADVSSADDLEADQIVSSVSDADEVVAYISDAADAIDQVTDIVAAEEDEMEWADELIWGTETTAEEETEETLPWMDQPINEAPVEDTPSPAPAEISYSAPAIPTSSSVPNSPVSADSPVSVHAPLLTPSAPVAAAPVAAPQSAAQPLQFQFDEQNLEAAKIKVVGVGGGGGNAVNYMIEKGLDSVEYVALNTDAQALKNNKATTKIQVGSSLTGGLGAGARPEVGREAIEENRHEIEEAIEGADMVFITAGMGGGTGTGGAPIVANIAKRKGILTVGIVTTPFDFEGRIRMQYATEGIMEMRAHCDTLIVIPNERLWELSEEVTSMVDSFAQANDVLYNATRGISDLILLPGLINLDFADVRTTMTAGGAAIMGSASATGAERAEIAAHEAINSPLLDGVSIRGARNVLVNISSSKSLRMQEFALANSIIKNEAGDDAEIIMGTVLDESFGDELRITVIATGFEFQEGSFQVQSKTAGTTGVTGTRSSFTRTGYTPSAHTTPTAATSKPGVAQNGGVGPAFTGQSLSTHSAAQTNAFSANKDNFSAKPAVPGTHTDPMQMDRRLEKDSTDFYRGEQNLKILDAPAIHRRTLKHTTGQTVADEDIRPIQPIGDNATSQSPTASPSSTKYPNWQPKQKIDKSDSEQPAFLRRIMD